MSSAVAPAMQFSTFFCACGQTIAALHKARPKRLFFVASIFFIIIVLLSLPSQHAIPAAVRDFSSNVVPLPGFLGSKKIKIHPIEALHDEWTTKFNRKVASQSRTLEEAVKKYQQKYHRLPPAGFDRWYNYAVDNDYIMIDEFDTLMDTLEPYWLIEPRELRTRLALSDGDGSLTQIYVKNGNATGEWEDNTHVLQAIAWINKFNTTGLFPDMNFTVNTLDEPRVSAANTDFDPSTSVRHTLPKGEDENMVEEYVDSGDYDAPLVRNRLEWLNLNHRKSWPYLSASCPEGVEPVSREYGATTLPFLDVTPSHQDFCTSVGMLDEHGFFQFPATLHMTQTLTPVFSQAAPSRFNDILWPSPYYLGSARDRPNAHEPDWNLKFNVLYWAGSSTGGYHVPEHWMDVQRARVAATVSPRNKMPVTLLKSTRSRVTGSIYQPIKSTWSKISHYFHVRITHIVQCQEEACDEMETSFAPVQDEPSSMAEQYKYVLDIDGNSFSGRFYRLLKSKSAILKSTIFREWHDDLLFPWVHFIPVSTGANELGETLRYLATEGKGDQIGKSVAEKSREWAGKVLREADMEIYFLRIMLEYGRLMNDDRDNENLTGFVPGQGRVRNNGKKITLTAKKGNN